MSTENQNQEIFSPEAEDPMLSFVELNESTKKENTSKPRRIRRRTLHLILTSAGTLLLAAVLLVVMLTGNQHDPVEDPIDTEPTDSVTETPMITLLDKSGQDGNSKAATLKSIAVENKDDRYSIVLDSKNSAYRIAGYEDIDLATDMVLTLRKYTEVIEAAEQIKEVGNLSIYGLDKPQASAAITYSDDTSTKIYVGDTTPSDNGYYCQIEGDKNVYIFPSDTASLFRFSSTAYASTTLLVGPTPKTDDKAGKALLG